jgi:tRNA uridine 5-carbamoylmethylation protein Kti12
MEVGMTTKEMILAEINALDEERLRELYRIIAEFVRSKQVEQPSLMSRLQRIKIQGPNDLAANHDLYVTGAKR